MRVYIRDKTQFKWLDITKYVNGVIVINETVDKTFDNISFSILTNDSLYGYDMSKPIPPKWLIKFSDVDSDELETTENTLYFVTQDINNARKSRKIVEVKKGLYEQEISGYELLSLLDNRYLPNYTITQPKTQFFSTHTASAGVDFMLNQRIEHNGEGGGFLQGTRTDLAGSNNTDDKISFGFENGKYYVEFTDIQKVPLVVDLGINQAKTASSVALYKRLGFINTRQNIGVLYGEGSVSNQIPADKSKTEIEYEIIKYNGLTELSSTKEILNYDYSTGEIDATMSLLGFGSLSLNHLGIMSFAEKTLTINRDLDATKVRVYFNFINDVKQRNIYRYFATDGYLTNDALTDINGFNDNTLVKLNIESLKIKATTGTYNDELEEKKQTILEFLEKSIFDYNLNSRNKYSLNDDVKPLLDIDAKEAEFGDYNLRELLERTFEYVGLRPKLNYDNTITYKKTEYVSRYIDLEQVSGKESEQVSEDFYDKVISNTKNLISQEDFVREILPLTSIETEFSQLTTENGGFVTSNKVYFVSNAILYTPELLIDFGGGVTVNTNMGKPFHWDITKRLFEEDIYNSFPNVRIDYNVPANNPSLRSYFSLLSQGNTISYKSGSNYISGIFHQADSVPDYKWDIRFAFQDHIVPNPEYAVIEMIIMLAYQQVSSLPTIEPKPDINLGDIANYVLDITYCPIFDDITTKYVSNMENRKGLDWEKKLNIKDRTISYQENEEVLRNEMETKGNVKTLFNDIYSAFDGSIPVNSIVNDNLYITSKKTVIRRGVYEVEYLLQENFILQSEDIRLPVEFERYNVPYEYVEREIMLENHIIFSKNDIQEKYNFDLSNSGETFLRKTMFSKNEAEGIEGTLYANMTIDSKDYLMRFAKLETRFTMILSGRFLDNYSAGIQRYKGSLPQEFYTIPYRYSNGNGKFETLNNLSIGWSSNAGIQRLKNDYGSLYDMKMFPAGKYNDVIDYTAVIDTRLVHIDENIMLIKDAREKTAITHTSYLQTETQDIKFYNFSKINKIGVLNNDVSLNDKLTLKDVDYIAYDLIFNYNLVNIGKNTYRIDITGTNIERFAEGIVLYNNKDNRDKLVGVVKKPIIMNGVLMFYVAITQYGFKPLEKIGMEIGIFNSNNVYITTENISQDNMFMSIYNSNFYNYDITFKKEDNLFITINNSNYVSLLDNADSFKQMVANISNQNVLYLSVSEFQYLDIIVEINNENLLNENIETSNFNNDIIEISNDNKLVLTTQEFSYLDIVLDITNSNNVILNTSQSYINIQELSIENSNKLYATTQELAYYDIITYISNTNKTYLTTSEVSFFNLNVNINNTNSVNVN